MPDLGLDLSDIQFHSPCFLTLLLEAMYIDTLCCPEPPVKTRNSAWYVLSTTALCKLWVNTRDWFHGCTFSGDIIPWFVTTTIYNFPMLGPITIQGEALLEGPDINWCQICFLGGNNWSKLPLFKLGCFCPVKIIAQSWHSPEFLLDFWGISFLFIWFLETC